jgi:hypothetical protein
MRQHRGHSGRRPVETAGHKLAFPAVLLGSLFVIALVLYAIDSAPLRGFLSSP